METFSALVAICAGNSPVTGEFPARRPMTRRFDVFFDLRPNKRLSKQWWGWWLETPSRPLWRQCNGSGESNSYPVIIIIHSRYVALERNYSYNGNNNPRPCIERLIKWVAAASYYCDMLLAQKPITTKLIRIKFVLTLKMFPFDDVIMDGDHRWVHQRST